jgi:hypothetical protein
MPGGACPRVHREGGIVMESLLKLTLPLALAIGIWVAVVLPWGGG